MEQIKRRLSAHRTLRYLLSGGITYAVEFGTFLILYYACGLPSGVAAALSYAFAWVVNYLLAHHFVFGDYEKVLRKSLPRYMSVALFNLLFNTFAVQFLVETGLKAYVAKFCVSALIALWTYVAYKKFVFVR